MYVISCLTYLLGSIISLGIKVDITGNCLILGILFGFAIEALILWATSNIKYYQGIFIAAIQPVLTLSMLVLITNLVIASTSMDAVLSLYL